MRGHAVPCAEVMWIGGVAERLPLASRSADGVMCILAAHHFTSLADAAREIIRICPEGPVVFFTMDPRTGERTWFEDYFPEIRANDFRIFPPLSEVVATVAQATGRRGAIDVFSLPGGLVDQFMYAPWRYPETYLNPTFRENTSGFASADPTMVERSVAALREDLESGAWDVRYGHLRRRANFDAGFRFVVFPTR